MERKPIVIIGAGIGGLSAAIRLQSAGYPVVVIEKNEHVGGKLSQIEQNGYRFDTGPSVITMRHVLEDLFASANRNLDDYLVLRPVEPMTRYFYRDGTVLDATSDLSKMARQIEQMNERDVEGYLSYLAYAARIHRITGPVFIYDKPPTLRSFTRVPVQDWLKSDPLRTMSQAINSHVQSPHLRQLMGRFATYVGGSPYEAPATLNVIAHVELTGGVWYPQGGIYKVAQALQKLAEELGVHIHSNCSAKQIRVENGRAIGVLLQDDSVVNAQVVIANADVTTVYNHLLPDGSVSQKRVQQLSTYEPSCSGFVMLLGIEGQHGQLAHHNIFFSDDYPAEFEAIFRKRKPADNPTIYIAITSKTDEEHAPTGCENWFVLVNAPALSEHYDWDENKIAYRDLILEQLAAYGLDVRDNIRTETLITPLDLQRMSAAWRGALYGPSANKKWTAFLRPHNRCNDINGLYFVGGTTHPGGGIPMVMLSGKVVADMVQEDINT